jgi:hypothetical protein
MSQQRCPACDSTDAAFLEHISKAAEVEYFRCRYCGHVWNTPKHDPEGKPRHVTPLPEEETDEDSD